MSNAATEAPMMVSLSIPCRPEYVGVARLVILGVASRYDFNYDEVEDLRLAVGEACTGAMECAVQPSDIHIRCEINPSELAVIVNYTCEASGLARSEVNSDPENIGALLMKILVDSVEIEDHPESGTTIRLTKIVQAR